MSFELMTPERFSADREARRVVGTTAGMQREAFMKFMTDHKDSGEIAFSVPYGAAVVWVMTDGSVVPGRTAQQAKNAAKVAEEIPELGDSVPANLNDAASDRFYIHPDLEGTCVAGAAPLGKMIDTMPVAGGVYGVVAGAGAGKTPVSHWCAAYGRNGYGVVRAGEPFSGYTTNQLVIAEAIGNAILRAEDVVIDSIKDLLAQAGNAMKGGIARNALLDLSAWSILGATVGTTFFVPINPSSNDKETVALMLEVAKSNTTGTLTFESGDAWRYSVRTGEGEERKTGTVNVTRGSVPTAEHIEARQATRTGGTLKRKSRDLSGILSGVTARSQLFKV